MDSVQKITTSLVDRTLGVGITRPAISLHVGEKAEAPARPAQPIPADRVAFSALPKGKPAVSAEVQQAFGARSVSAGGGIQGSRPPLGEDLAWIAFKDRTSADIAAYVQDPAVMAMAEMALLDPGRRRLEHDVKEWLGFDHKPEIPDSTRVDLFRLSLGAKVSGLSKEQLAIQPGLDLVKVRTPDIDDISLSAGFPINLAGQVHLRTHLQVQKGLDPEAEQAIDSRIGFDSQDREISFKFGLRQRTGQDEALAFYAQQTTPLDSRPTDLGLGFYLQKQW